MIINNAPANEAIISNVGQIGEFRIRNSAKAFSILSSGLYANKIRAIVRELSTNAVDSHIAAGKGDVPFDVHLPNQLEPWFAIRDYGTGLTHDQVTNIYTTYFESTKTDSNDFTGCLGLGSKSPFSYTDNFTVTAIRDGKKGIYTAFINEQGVPSIALMMTEDTDEPSGVEVKFAVNENYDFHKFRDEARQVYTYFKLRPVVTGNADFKFVDVEYLDKDLIPGVHSMSNVRSSKAVMGNIAYPIDIPNVEQALGDLRHLINCGLELNFGIGELDMQASREGLSYIPQTVEAIKNKLAEVNAVLATKLAVEADAIENLWERAEFLNKKRQQPLWFAAVCTYSTTASLPTFVEDRYGSWTPARFEFKVADLAKDYNIQLRGFHRPQHARAVKMDKPSLQYGDKNSSGHYETWQSWIVGVNTHAHFVINDLKTGATERAKYHYRETKCDVYNRSVWVIEPVDRTKPMLLDAFFAAIHNPPVANRVNASSLLQKTRTGVTKDVSIMKLTERGHGGYYRQQEMVWRDAGDTSGYATTDITGKPLTYYYIPLNGFMMQSAKGYTSGRELFDDVNSFKGLFNDTIYGVRKKDIEEIKKRPNWKNFEDHISEVLAKRDMNKLLRSLVRAQLDNTDILSYTRDVLGQISKDSPYYKLVDSFTGVEKFEGNVVKLNRLFSRFAPKVTLDPASLKAGYQTEINNVNRRYPLLRSLSTYRVSADDIAEYVNLIDAKKGI